MTPKETDSLRLLTKINVGTAIAMVAVLFAFHSSNISELRAMNESLHEVKTELGARFADHEVRINHLERGH